MTTIQTVVLIAHTVIALLIIVLVLLQRGKGADAGAAFGAGASGTVFGAQGSSNFFSRATAIMATVFFASSLALAYMSSQSSVTVDSLLEDAAPIEISVDDESVDDLAEAAEDLLPDLGDEEAAPVETSDDGEMPALEAAPEETDEEQPQP
jgi:preprotein translocase subunit SecG